MKLDEFNIITDLNKQKIFINFIDSQFVKLFIFSKNIFVKIYF